MRLLGKFLSIMLLLAVIFSLTVAEAKKNEEPPRDPNLMRKLEVKSSDKEIGRAHV